MASLLDKYAAYRPDQPTQQAVNFITQAKRALLFARRAKGGAYGSHDPYVQNTQVFTKDYEAMRIKRKNIIIEASVPAKAYNSKRQKRFTTIRLLDIDAKGYNKGLEVIPLPYIPRELNYNTESNFALIKPLGANNPRYQYTGSEDKIEFEIDWFDEYGYDGYAIEHCRKLEALAKADGYTGKPHRVLLQWGKKGRLFNGMEFIVTAAPYILSNFSGAHIAYPGDIRDWDGLPRQATQKITLCKITDHNLSRKEIRHHQSATTTDGSISMVNNHRTQ